MKRANWIVQQQRLQLNLLTQIVARVIMKYYRVLSDLVASDERQHRKMDLN
jgi:hypothetical protein